MRGQSESESANRVRVSKTGERENIGEVEVVGRRGKRCRSQLSGRVPVVISLLSRLT